MLEIKKYITLYYNFVEFLSDLLGIRAPYIVYVNFENGNTVSYDEKLNIVSYDKRDVGIDVADVSVVPIQYTFYINTTYGSDKTKALILLAKRMRYLYQIKQARDHITNKLTEIDTELAQSWAHEFNPPIYQKEKETNNQVSPAELDRKAFSKIIMKECFGLTVNYEIETGFKDNEGGYNRAINNVLKYHSIPYINVVLSKYELIMF